MNKDKLIFTLPSKDLVFGDKASEVFKVLGTKCKATDVAILTGATVSKHYKVSNDSSIKGRTCDWFLADKIFEQNVSIVSTDGNYSWTHNGSRFVGVRPIAFYQDLGDLESNMVVNSLGLKEIEYGEYFSYGVDPKLQKILFENLKNNHLLRTGKTYTVNQADQSSYSEEFNPIAFDEYMYLGEKYVLVKANRLEFSSYNSKHQKVRICSTVELSNSQIATNGDYYWVKVSPIKWFVDTQNKMLVCENIIAAGMIYCNFDQYDGTVETTEIYNFLNKFFSKDIIPSIPLTKTEKMVKPALEIDEIDEIQDDIVFFSDGKFNNLTKKTPLLDLDSLMYLFKEDSKISEYISNIKGNIVVTIEDVINDNYHIDKVRQANSFDKYKTTLMLFYKALDYRVTYNHFLKIYDFIRNLGTEYLNIFRQICNYYFEHNIGENSKSIGVKINYTNTK